MTFARLKDAEEQKKKLKEFKKGISVWDNYDNSHGKYYNPFCILTRYVWINLTFKTLFFSKRDLSSTKVHICLKYFLSCLKMY